METGAFSRRRAPLLLDDTHPGDAYFPELDPTEWTEVERSRGRGASFVKLARRGA